MCGEMIVATAAKCRFCGEVFDPTIKKLKKGGKGKKARMAAIASSQRNLIICILIQIVLYIATARDRYRATDRTRSRTRSPCIVALGLIAAGIAGTVFTFMLTMKIYSTAMGVILGLLTLVPCIGFLVLLSVNSSATKLLRESGHHVGFLGADMSEF